MGPWQESERNIGKIQKIDAGHQIRKLPRLFLMENFHFPFTCLRCIYYIDNIDNVIYRNT